MFATPVFAADGPVVDKRATLPDIAVSSIQTSITNDRDVLLGGIGSGLFSLGKSEYWTITDRGPNGDVATGPGAGAKSFLLPQYTPHLVKIRVKGTKLQVLATIPITTLAGDPVTGLPNFPVTGDTDPYLSDWEGRADYNPNGLDTEGVVRTADGSFWIVDEYGPSIVHLDASGHVLERFVPEGTAAGYSDVLQLDGSTLDVGYPITEALPASLAARRSNRGFEDIALLPDGHTVVVALQSPADKKSLVSDLVEFDTATGEYVHTYSYAFDDPAVAGTWQAGVKTSDLKISALIPVDQTHVIVEERTDAEARFYTVSLDKTDDVIAGADKALLANLAGIAGVPGKIEGAALKNSETLVIISDNDFGFDTTVPYALDADITRNGLQTVLAEIKLP